MDFLPQPKTSRSLRGFYLLLWHLRERLAPARESGTEPRGSTEPKRLRRGDDARFACRVSTPSLGRLIRLRVAGVHAGAVRERGAEMRSETSPRVLVFSLRCPERNAVSIATCRHSVMTGGACACV